MTDTRPPADSPARPVTLTHQGHTYWLHQGRVMLNWRNRTTLFHPKGCPLCCTNRVQAGNGKPRHPADCPVCGPRFTGRRPDPCHICGRTAHFLDDFGRPVHKTCLEAAITAGELATGEELAA